MGYREDFFRYNPSPVGLWMCVKCKRMFPKSKITVDHIIPKRHGGTDDISNLQAMCKSCNSSKGDDVNILDYANSLTKSALNGNLDDAIVGIAQRKVKDALHIKYKRK